MVVKTDNRGRKKLEVNRFQAIARYGDTDKSLGVLKTAQLAALCVARNEKVRKLIAVQAAEDARYLRATRSILVLLLCRWRPLAVQASAVRSVRR